MTHQDTGSIVLVEMGEPSYRKYRETLIRDYAADKARAGVWSREEAEGKSASDIDGLLPRGPATPNHYLYSVRDQSLPAEIGVLWISPQDAGVGRSVWIYDIIVHENFRRQGYATRILNLTEDRARELGADKVEFQVFGHNQAARALYEKAGYRPTSIIMSKPLTPTTPEHQHSARTIS